MVGVLVAAKRIPGVQHTVLRQIQMVLGNEFLQVGRAQMIFLAAVSVLKVECVDAQLVRHHHIGIIRHPACHPVVAADGLEPPDLVHILKRDAVHLIGTVLFQQTAQPPHALPGRVDVGQHEIDDVLLTDAAGHFGLLALGRLVHHQRVGSQHAGVRGDGLGGRHADICRIDARSRPDALALHGVGHGRHPHRVPGQRDLDVRQHRAVDCRVLFRMDDHKFLGREMPRTRVVVAGDHGGAVIRSVFTN